MKLRNLLFGTMIACAFAACSNEDDPIPSVDPTPTPEAGSADLTIVVKNLTKSLNTKAAEEEVDYTQTGEADIVNLFVALYNEDGTFIQTSNVVANEDGETTDTNNEIKFEGLKAGATYRALAFANIPEAALTGSANSFNLTTDYYVLTGTGVTGLPMSSGISDKFTLKEGANYYGYTGKESAGNSIASGKPLGLIRNVARVELSSLELDMTRVKETVGNSSVQKYTSGTVTFTPGKVFVLHGRTMAKAADVTIDNTSWFNQLDVLWGSVASTYASGDAEKYFSGTKTIDDPSYFGRFAGTVDATNYIKALDDAATAPVYEQKWTKSGLTSLKKDDVAVASSKKKIDLAESLYFYVLPNNQTSAAREQVEPEEGTFTLNKLTLASELVISGDFYAKATLFDGTTWEYGTAATPVKRYWPIKIGIDGLAVGSLYGNGVQRNVVYQISATIAGNGYGDPTIPKDDPTADLFIKTMVMDWGTATQAPVIE